MLLKKWTPVALLELAYTHLLAPELGLGDSWSQCYSPPAELPLGHSEWGCCHMSMASDRRPLECNSPALQFGYSHLRNFSWGDEPDTISQAVGIS